MMSSQLTENDVEITLPIVKITWMWHNREYSIGIRRFLSLLNLKPTDAEIIKAVRKLLNEQ